MQAQEACREKKEEVLDTWSSTRVQQQPCRLKILDKRDALLDVGVAAKKRTNNSECLMSWREHPIVDPLGDALPAADANPTVPSVV